MNDAYVHTVALMGTVVTFHVVGHGADRSQQGEREAAVARAVAWFQQIEEQCTRFDPDSEIARVSTQIGVPVHVSSLVYEVVQFALAVAAESGGAFDPTVGLLMEARGFNEEYRSGRIVRTDLSARAGTSFRDVHVDAQAQTVTLLRPLMLDLGGVAKGLAIDMAARELRPFTNFAIDAGGDLYLGGRNAAGTPWLTGIRHPRSDGTMIDTLHVSDLAVCTSGDYERRAEVGGIESVHIIDPRTGAGATALASATVVASSAMVADALATAAFVLGPADGLLLLERHGVDGLLITPALDRFATAGMQRLIAGAA